MRGLLAELDPKHPARSKLSVPARHGFRLVLATWETVTVRPDALVADILATLAASASA